MTAACESFSAGRARGRRVPERQGYLKLGVGSHIIFYRQDGAWIDVIRILHERMDVDLHL
ncbi:type II toxin-antitoxin system RelE/ParE family toxin [Aurantimonas sp. VKM B-3413]|nr:type II toxin-antitoxin system RelE/ParE family toxin [Aurantimonas sp. VKM B-3413]